MIGYAWEKKEQLNLWPDSTAVLFPWLQVYFAYFAGSRTFRTASILIITCPKLQEYIATTPILSQIWIVYRSNRTSAHMETHSSRLKMQSSRKPALDRMSCWHESQAKYQGKNLRTQTISEERFAAFALATDLRYNSSYCNADESQLKSMFMFFCTSCCQLSLSFL